MKFLSLLSIVFFSSSVWALPGAELAKDKNPSLTSSSLEGVQLGDIFTSEYLVVDISMLFCPYCRNMAEEHNNDQDFQKMFASETCNFIVVVPDDDREGWIAEYPVDTFIGERTYSYSESMRNFAKLFGLSLRGVPTVMVLDRAGELVAQAPGETPKEVYELCGVE
ncbi:TlpA family protein disulfide reductase [Pseudobacteriovorax antillogorgiicola]|uniref:Thioredoxin-related protein n=1 Tax=Pseudobacteriovorax antillogorgiicola TaxID=1513793 RepID=A0A1Y6CBY6_9BACT|nr:thioredoxin fold domain-containing protein [Pseudobacteriovorax antillogorgiicola]TCS49905.1 thioredoxin-related protein [Pseudobacteriovorax antillogorgiicola]SMF44828.1 Thioredoxin-related protein [Pseudobacteriovorax antillogorgiicola]